MAKLTETTLQITAQLIRCGLILFEHNEEYESEELKARLGNNYSAVTDTCKELYTNGYLITDQEVDVEDIGKLDNLVQINCQKLFNDFVFDLDKDKDLYQWFAVNKEALEIFNSKSKFFMQLEQSGHILTSDLIMEIEEKILGYIERIRQGHYSQVIEIIYMLIQQIQTAVDGLPEEFSYAKETFSLKTYNNILKKEGYSLFREVGRNDNCPCNSGKKYKKCCMED